jgi:hypothetical protein
MLVGCACLNVILTVSREEVGGDPIPAGFRPAVLQSKSVQLPSLLVTTAAASSTEQLFTCGNCRQVCFRARNSSDGTPILYHESLKV